jgi:glycosyltransferase involved in cell wall biosynthesis
VEKGISKLNRIFCNSYYTKKAIMQYWSNFNVKEPVIIRPPVELKDFWCYIPLEEKEQRVVYVARFAPIKRHGLMKQLAKTFPSYEFVSVGALTEGMKDWFRTLSKGAPRNYFLKPNLPKKNLIELLKRSKIYVHLMEGEHFGIAPLEALASGCIVLVHDSGGIREYIPKEFRWKNLDDLKEKIDFFMKMDEQRLNSVIEDLREKVKELNPDRFMAQLWVNLKKKSWSEN